MFELKQPLKSAIPDGYVQIDSSNEIDQHLESVLAELNGEVGMDLPRETLTSAPISYGSMSMITGLRHGNLATWRISVARYPASKIPWYDQIPITVLENGQPVTSRTIPAGEIGTYYTTNYQPGNVVSARLDWNPSTANLVAAYSFDEGAGGTVLDSSGNNFSGTMSDTTWIPEGRFGSALSFNGYNSMVTVNDAPLLRLGQEFTLEAWVYPTAPQESAVMIKESLGQGNYYLQTYPGSSGSPIPSFGINVDGTSTHHVALNDLPLNTWSHLAAVWDGSNTYVYVNGSLVGTQPTTGLLSTSTEPLRIGGSTILPGDGGGFFQGRIDEVRIYNRALSVNNIRNDMNKPSNPAIAPIPTSDPNMAGVKYWDLYSWR